MNRTKVLVTAMGDVIAGNNNNSMKAFAAYFESLFPFTAKTRDDEELKLKEAMRREVDRGPLSFSPVTKGPLQRAAAKYKLPDEFRQGLRKRAKAKP